MPAQAGIHLRLRSTTDSLHYIQGKQEMLFQWRRDPEERSNLVSYEESRELVNRLRLFWNERSSR